MNKSVANLIRMALAEDIGSGDITTELLDPRSKVKDSRSHIILKEEGVVAGLPLAQLVYQVLDKKVKFVCKVKDGRFCKKGTVIAEVSGPAKSILAGERLALNFLQRMSGIATLTRKFVDKIKGTKCVILDTRKTIPLWRGADKYAVLAGGGKNHRFGLFDAILIKDNHIKIAGGIEEAIKSCRRHAMACLHKIEVEAKTMSEVKKAISAGAAKILLDNMNLKNLRRAVSICKKAKVWCEASGGVNLKNVRAVAKTGVDAISIGALTHSPKALDITMKIKA